MRTLLLTIILSLSFCSSLMAQKKKVIIKYKKFEKFDFEDMSIEGDSSSPGDLSVNPRLRKKFLHALPNRRHFKEQVRNAMESFK